MLEMMNQYVVPVTIAFCLVIGQLIKQFPRINNRYIPVIVAIFGLFFNIWTNDFNVTPIVVLQGLASGLASTGAFELVKNVAGKEDVPLKSRAIGDVEISEEEMSENK